MKFFNIISKIVDFILYSISFIYSKKPIPPATNPLLHISATVLADQIRRKQVSSFEVVSAYIKRCKEVNPLVNAIVEDRFKDAIQDAIRVDDFLSKNQKTEAQLKKESPLLGIPITVKESCSLKGMKCTRGLPMLAKYKSKSNGAAVDLILKSGAIPIAVTNVPPLCMFVETFNLVIGYTCNPHDRSKVAGGSSGGEAALIASGGSVLGLGSDSGGSIRIPTFFTGLFGHKPSRHMVPNSGHMPWPLGEDFQNATTIGPLCRYAEDLELAMNVLSRGKVNENSLENKINFKHIKVYYLEEASHKKPVDSEIKLKILQAANHLKQAYGCDISPLNIPEMRKLFKITDSSLHNLIKFEVSQPSQLVNKSWTQIFTIPGLISHYFNRIHQQDKHDMYRMKEALFTALTNLLGNDGILIMPTVRESACYRFQTLLRFMDYVTYTFIANDFGFPATNVPVGRDRTNMPIGIQIMANRNQDKLCIAAAKELETVFGGWVAPYDVKTKLA